MIETVTTFDTRLLEALYTMRDPSLVQFLVLMSELGRAWIIYAFGTIVFLLLVQRRHAAHAVGLGISLATSGLGVLLLKGLIERPRPPETFQAYFEIWYSFPSAHTALSIALYGFLALLTWRFLPQGIWRYIAISGLLLLILLIAFGRLYLGVHYMSDVLAGVLLGLLCVWLGWKYAKIADNGHR